MHSRRVHSTFTFFPVPGGSGFGVTSASGWSTVEPLAFELVFSNGSVAWLRSAYSSVNSASGIANGKLTTPEGSIIDVADAYTNSSEADCDGFSLRRNVTILMPRNSGLWSSGGGNMGGEDVVAFSSRYTLDAPPPLARAPRGLFLPGISYSNASALPPHALAGDPLAAYILVREDRLPLPFALAHFPGAGAAHLAHRAPDGRTLPNEDFTARIVSAEMQFGSLGFLNDLPAAPLPALSLAFQFPGSEGGRTYVYDPDAGGWANRSHPLAEGVPHAYALTFCWWRPAGAAENASFADAATRAWRFEFAAAAPSVPAPTPSPAQLYRSGMDLLAGYAVAYDGVVAMPFEAALPAGLVVDNSSQMGFVGRALPCAALLLFDAVVAAPNASRAAAAAALIDVWVAHAPTACGAVRTWFNIAADGSISWRPSDAYQGSLRIMCDGIAGLLAAWRVRPTAAAWLAAAVQFADFLVRVQRADGALFSAYDWSCEPLAADTRQTAQAVPVLAAAFAATRDPRYAAAATAAGTYAAAQLDVGFSYSGGAVDNPDVPDREAGWLAAQAFIALFEMTGDAGWLQPASRAAAYAETFVYAWRVPIPCGQVPPAAYPCRRTTLGASLIATGQSGADNYMSIAHVDYARLGAWLNDSHFTAVGAFLEAATSQVTDWDGSLGYAARGLMHEAATLSVRRGAGVASWLPWLTANLLQPLVQRMEAAMPATLHEYASGTSSPMLV